MARGLAKLTVTIDLMSDWSGETDIRYDIRIAIGIDSQVSVQLVVSGSSNSGIGAQSVKPPPPSFASLSYM